MGLSGENILIILLVGLVIGLLPSTLVERTRRGFLRDIACGIGGIVIAALLTLAWRNDALTNLWPNKAAKKESVAPPLSPLCCHLQHFGPFSSRSSTVRVKRFATR